jgi:hypothetical protein
MIKDKKTIKKDILDKFRSINPDDDYILQPHWLESQYVETLTKTEKKNFLRAVKELMSKGLIEPVDGPVHHLKLTEKGINLIS